MIRREATVALGGDGGDELFGGYPHHSWIQSQERWRERVPAAVRRAARPLVAATLPPGTRGRNYVLGLTGDRSHAVAQFNQLFDEGWRAALLDRPRRPSDLVADFKARLESADTSAIRQATATDFRTYLVDDILVKVDRASMLASLEVRAPWLDHRLIEFAFRDVPDALRATASERKVLPRRLARRVLPPGLDLSRKQGFSLPLDAWFKGEWGAFVRDVLTDPGQRLFRRDVIETLLRGQQRGRMNTHRLFALSMFELWRREYGVTLP
jgi:asparagine synthase (glutamine-hydrolysing)